MADNNKPRFSNTDERGEGDWQTRYKDKKIRRKQRVEMIYLFILLIVAIVLLCLFCLDCFTNYCNLTPKQHAIVNKMIICALSGFLGGVINDMKWFYHSVARGYWNEDRVYWRLLTPFISLVIAIIIGCIFSENMIINGSIFSSIILGFLSGYFSDEAAGKMGEVAQVLFNTKTEIKNRENANEEDSDNSQR